jgi:SAM-dependent methyltransferase
MRKVTTKFLDRSFWLDENTKYEKPYFRLEKCARIVNRLAEDRDCDLLDVGCGPATLALLLNPNITYYGIDLAIHDPAPNLLEMDFAKGKIGFQNRAFDIVVAAGVFEYMGGEQRRKLDEIRSILVANGTFVVTYTNFHHLRNNWYYYPYNNVLPLRDFMADLQDYFHIRSWFPSSHNSKIQEPRRRWLKMINMNLNFSIPIFSHLLAVNYFFVCSPKNASGLLPESLPTNPVSNAAWKHRG